jgi:hypothetical protein
MNSTARILSFAAVLSVVVLPPQAAATNHPGLFTLPASSA